MKTRFARIISLLLVIVLAIGCLAPLTSCSQPNNENPSENGGENNGRRVKKRTAPQARNEQSAEIVERVKQDGNGDAPREKIEERRRAADEKGIADLQERFGRGGACRQVEQVRYAENSGGQKQCGQNAAPAANSSGWRPSIKSVMCPPPDPPTM